MEYHDWTHNREWYILCVTVATWLFFPYVISSTKNFYNTTPWILAIILATFWPFKVFPMFWDLLLVFGITAILYLPFVILVGRVQGFLDKRFEIVWQ